MADKAESKGKAAISMAPTESSSSSSSSSSSKYTYHVLSLTADDVRHNFGDWLFHALGDAGLHPFDVIDQRSSSSDREEYEDIQKALSESKLLVVVFSKEFASSIYCLEILTAFIDRWKRNEVQVLPVFFKVNPDDVGGAVGGPYGAPFQMYEEALESLQGERLAVGKYKLGRWRTALRQVAEITGRHFYDIGYQSEFIREVVEDAKRMANLVTLDIPSRVVGKPYRFSGLEHWVQDRTHDKRIALLHGGHGIGKKTNAAVVFNQNYADFDATAFLDKVGEKSKSSHDTVKLQSQLLCRLRKPKGNSDIASESEGVAAIKEALKSKRVLIVLADLDQPDQFLKLIPGPEFLEQGSRVIVTSVNERLLGDRFCDKFPVEPLNPGQSLELLSWHAFGTPRPMQGYEARVMAASRYCSGIPLALEKLAPLLSSSRMDCWDGSVPAGTHEDPKLRDDLETSFASLKTKDKKLFLDIACFYAGMDFDHVDSVLNSCNLYMEGGFDRLRSRHLVSVETVHKDKNVTMSQPCIDMGRETVRKTSDFVEEFTNIWSPEDAIELFRDCNYQGSRHIRSFVLDGTQLEASEKEFRTESFTGMTKLKLLKLVNIKLEGDFKHLPKGLVWLSINFMPLRRMPDDISLKDLVVLELSNSGLQELWNETRTLGKLKILNLSRTYLKKTPDFSRLRVPNLERLILDVCIYLKEIDPSIEVLASLVQLNLSRCCGITLLPVLGSPIKLDISSCISLLAMPNRRAESVKELCADGNAMNQLWSEPPGFSFSAIFPCLVKLSLIGCKLSGEKIISDLVELRALEDLDLSHNLFTVMPEALGAFVSLRTLSLDCCKHLEVVKALPRGLEKLSLNHCESLKKIDGVVRPAMEMFAVGCVNLVQVGEASRSEAMQSDDMKMMNDLQLYSWESSASSYEIEMANTCTGSIKKTPVQEQLVQFHCGTFNFFVRGSAIPAWYDHQTEGETILVYPVQPEPGCSIVGINLCVVYKTRGQYTSYPFHVIVGLAGRDSKDLRWGYNPMAYATANEEDMTWSSHWNLTGHIAPGDALLVNVSPATQDVEVTRFGICLVSEDEVKLPISSSTWYQKLNVDLSTYEVSPGHFNLTNPCQRWGFSAGYPYLYAGEIFFSPHHGGDKSNAVRHYPIEDGLLPFYSSLFGRVPDLYCLSSES